MDRASSRFSPKRISRQNPHRMPLDLPPTILPFFSEHGHQVFWSVVFCLQK